jgi:peptidoglycan/xylan/chitin deacetylase (PgdA/CDA1 family)
VRLDIQFKFKLITLLLIWLLLITVGNRQTAAFEPQGAESIFKANQLESRLRTPVENLLFLTVIEHKLNNRELTKEELKLLHSRREYSKKVLVDSYHYLYHYFHSSIENQERIENIVDRKKTAAANNEIKLLTFIIDRIKADKKEIKLEVVPEINQEKSSYIFYQKFVEDLLTMADKHPQISSQVFAIDKREKLGFEGFARKLALTFDDGPSARTEKILDILAGEDVPAVFFLQGSKLVNQEGTIDPIHRQNIKQALKLDITLGAHSFTHPVLEKIETEEELEYEINKVQEVIKDNFDYTPSFFRAPYGRRDEKTLEYIYKAYDEHILWNIDTLDWHNESSEETIKTRVIRLAHLYNGGIVLFHDPNQKTAAVLPEIIEELKGCGFNFTNLEKGQLS